MMNSETPTIVRDKINLLIVEREVKEKNKEARDKLLVSIVYFSFFFW